MLQAFIAVLMFYLLLWLIENLVPPLIEGIGLLFRFLAIVAAVACASVALASYQFTFWLAVSGYRHVIAPATQFVFILVAELWRELTGNADEPYEDFCDEDEDGDACSDPYGEALALFGLEDGFTRKAFDAAYRSAMKRAHPDLGGSTAEAQTLNSARDLVMVRHGWA